MVSKGIRLLKKQIVKNSCNLFYGLNMPVSLGILRAFHARNVIIFYGMIPLSGPSPSF